MHGVKEVLGLAEIVAGELLAEQLGVGGVGQGREGLADILEPVAQGLDLGLQGSASVQADVRGDLRDEAAQLRQALLVLCQGVLADLKTTSSVLLIMCFRMDRRAFKLFQLV